MKKHRSRLATPITLAFPLIIILACAYRTPEIHFRLPPRSDTSVVHLHWRIDSLMKSHFRPDGPGVVLAVERDPLLSKNSDERAHKFETRFYFETGLSELNGNTPVTQVSVFNIGSLTKQFTARTILTLLHARKIPVSAPIGQFLDGLPHSIAAVKLSQLLSHCSGIPDHYSFTDTNRVKHATDKDVLDAIKKADTLYFTAGTRYKYSNTAYCLLGMLAERLTDSSYEIEVPKSLYFAKNHLHYPHLKSLAFLKPTAVIGNRVHAYEKDKSGHWAANDAPQSIFFTTQADGGMLISMKDYMTWCQNLEFEYLSGSTTTAGFVEEFQPHTVVDTAAGLYYGYGWFVLPRKNAAGPLIYHTGFNGGFRTSVLLIPAIGYRIALFSASPETDLEELMHQINVILGIDDKGFIKSGPLES